MKKRIPKPTLKEVGRFINKLEEKYPQYVKTEIIGYSPAGLPVRMVKVTDKTVSCENKTNVLIVGGHHGDEESGRAACIGVLEWLVTKEAREIIKMQQIIVIPCANVDGTLVNKHWNSENVNICSDYALYGKVTQPETRAIISVIERFNPDVTVDVHGLAGGAIHEMVMPVQTREYCEDEFIHNMLARDMRNEAEKKGYPMAGHSLSWSGWFDSELKNPIHFNTYCYKKYHAIGILTEGNEATLDYTQMKESGAARLIGLLKAGVKKYPFEYYPGYPNRIISGSFFFGLIAYGKTAEKRRESTIDILKNLDTFSFGQKHPVKRGIAEITVKYKGANLTKGASFRYRIKGFIKPKAVIFNGKKLKLSETNGFVTWRDHCSTYIQWNIPVLLAGEHKLVLKY
ncbi:MAG: hypothetical protein A2231_07375 [Candidatus Firestonebacteria bacterium RIFOXYA2_FULL_40_8]|nr:MAG: hypothetical protein A2231_07375 [Candidatus Firestonebacteria bacterium RIFOXYA2_FULL_40_8]